MTFKQGFNRDVLEKKSGGGFLILLGLPFFLAGLFIMQAPFNLIPAKWQGGPPPWFVAVPFGGIFAAVGAALIFARGGVTINTGDKTVVTWWGVLGYRKRTQHDLDTIDHVTISREVRRSKNSTYTVYPVRLSRSEKPINLEEPRDYKEARATAEQVAKFIEKDIVDTTSGKRIVRDFGSLDESLRDRARRTRESIELPEPPPAMKTRCSIEGRQVTLELPAGKFNAVTAIMLVFGCAVPAVVFFGFFFPMMKKDNLPKEMQYIVLGFVGVFFVLLPLVFVVVKAVSGAKRSVRIIASRDCLQVENRGLLFTKIKRIPSEELEELVLPKASAETDPQKAIEQSGLPPAARALLGALVRSKTRGIQARSDKETIGFGAGLPEDELRWIHAVITRMMTA